MAHLIAKDVHVDYPVYTTGRSRSIMGLAANRASFGQIAREAGHTPTVKALNGLSIELKEGDRLVLMGRNGSGKSTFLKLCAGIVFPNAGTFDVQGSRQSIFSTGGLDLDKTGVQNVALIGKLLGVPRDRREALLKDVADFTELGDFLNLPVRTYSSGMAVRLMFALATSVERDIVIVDEVIGTGDALFLEKAAKRVREMFDRAKILVLATHAGDIAQTLCNRAIWLKSGKIVMEGEPAGVWDAYLHQPPSSAAA